ncbi:MAG: SDR family oxidoreductase [Boseongicola sp. SB0676_bin_33]|nr:SDR family oxidoreductase [Boseongicola sp. SB0676_bin_33]
MRCHRNDAWTSTRNWTSSLWRFSWRSGRTVDLYGRTAFITGSAGVPGPTCVRWMLAAGAQVVASDLPGERAAGIKERHGEDCRFRRYGLDVSDEAEVEGIFLRIMGDGWEQNVVLDNAAVTGELLMGRSQEFPDLANTRTEEFETVTRMNLTVAFIVTRQTDRHIVGRCPATLINVAWMYAFGGPHRSIYDGMPFKNLSAYGVSKAGIHGLTVWLAGYWAGRQATVNTIAPGAVFNGHSREFQRRVSAVVMAGRMARPDEVADVMLFLASEAAGYMTGQLVNVDGGFSAW